MIVSLEPSHDLAVSSGKKAAFNQAVSYVLGKVSEGLISLELQQAYAGSPLSFATATKTIFQLTSNSEQSTSMYCIHFGKAETAQQIPHACVISVYQALPPVFRATGKEVVSSPDPTLSRGETVW